jgi:NADH:ubiquinone oxidoreductase subunit E
VTTREEHGREGEGGKGSRELTAAEKDKILELVGRYRGVRWSLIPLLQAIQEEIGYVPPQYVGTIADELGLFPAQVQGVVSFYSQFYSEPKGRYLVRVCQGTSCHVRGGRQILQAVREKLGIDVGETTEDGMFSLETVACLGTCFLSPAMMVGRDYYGLLTPRRVPSVLDGYAGRKKR